MTKRKIARWKKGKGIKAVTRTPDFILRIKGRFDAKKENLPEAFTEKQLKALAAIENTEVLTAENILAETRNSATKAICAIEEAKMGADPVRLSGSPTEDEIRAYRTATAKRRAALANAQSAKEALPAFNENIINIHAILDERIEKTRKKAYKKLMAYASGVKTGGKIDFKITANPDDKAREIYHSHHKRLDKLINDLVYSFLEPSHGENIDN